MSLEMNVVQLKIAEERKDLLTLFHNYLMTLLRSHLHMFLYPQFPITA
jgi:hypothetical protein